MARTCDVEGCNRAHLARGWCAAHHAWWMRNGEAPTHELGTLQGSPGVYKYPLRVDDMSEAEVMYCVGLFEGEGVRRPSGQHRSPPPREDVRSRTAGPIHVLRGRIDRAGAGPLRPAEAQLVYVVRYSVHRRAGGRARCDPASALEPPSPTTNRRNATGERGRVSVYQIGERVRVRRDRYGYKVKGANGEVYYRRVTTLNSLPQPWMGRWAAGQAAIRAIEQHNEIAHLLSVSSPEEIAAAAEALKNKDYRSKAITPNIRAAYDTLRNAPWDKRDAAADYGSVVHDTLEALAKGLPLPENLETEDQLQCVLNAEALWGELMEGGEVLHVEVTIVNPDGIVPYAGTFDIYGRTRTDETVLSDWKTPESGIHVDYVTQLLAYKHAPFALINAADFERRGKTIELWTAEIAEWGPHMVDRIMIAHIRPEFARLYEIKQEVHDQAWDVFQAASIVKTWSDDTDSYKKEPRIEVYTDPLLKVTA